MILVAAVELIVLHMVDGRPVAINPHEITQLVHPHEDGNKQLTDAVKCVVRFTDGGFVSVAETCEEVQQAVEGKKP